MLRATRCPRDRWRDRLARARGRRGLDRARRLHRTAQIHLERAQPDQREIGVHADVLVGNRLEHAVARPGERLAADVHGAAALDEHLALGLTSSVTMRSMRPHRFSSSWSPGPST
jgi:hypothetical protein